MDNILLAGLIFLVYVTLIIVGRFNIKKNINFLVYAFFVMVLSIILAKIFVYQASIFERTTSVPEIYLIISIIGIVILAWLSKIMVQKISNHEVYSDIASWLVVGLLFIFWPIWVPVIFNSV